MKLFLLVFFILSPVCYAQGQGLSCSALFSDGKSASPIPVISISDLTNVEPAGRGNLTAFWGDKKVFIKRLRNGSLNEAHWLQEINSLKLGVQLYGSLEIEGRPAVVIDYSAGINTQMPMIAPESFRLTQFMVSEIKRQAKVLAENSIIPVDLQFQISIDGKQIHIIDPELFRKASGPEEAFKHTETIVRNILLVWAMDGRL